MSQVSVIKGEDHITIAYPDGDVFTVYKSQPVFDQVVAASRQRDWETVRTLATPGRMIEQKSMGKIAVRGGEVFYQDEPVHNTLTQRIIDMLDMGLDIDPMLTFMDNLMSNPSERAQNELYDFLEYGKLPITNDGYFLAYKRIKDDWKDCHTGTIDNSIGQVVEMPREKVNADSNQTCSSGLHFCSREYLSSFYGSRLVVVKINPRDVVSIPNDYNNTKGRCCRYEVVTEIINDEQLEDLLLVSPVGKEDLTLEDVAVINLETPEENQRDIEPEEDTNSSLGKSFTGVSWLAGIRRRFFKR